MSNEFRSQQNRYQASAQINHHAGSYSIATSVGSTSRPSGSRFLRLRRLIGGGGITTIMGLPNSSASPFQPHIKHARYSP